MSSEHEHESLPVQRRGFRVDTTRTKSHSKRRAQIRHVLAVMSGMFPLGALFVFLMARFTLEGPQRHLPYKLAMAFLVGGMVSLLFYAIARANSTRRHEISRRNRELKYQRQAEELRLERERLAQKQQAARAADDGDGASAGRP